MTTKYTEKQIEDVARILRLRHDFYQSYEARLASESTAKAFVVLFAADNPTPSMCLFCGEPRGPDPLCFSRDTPDTGHSYTDGFDRDEFLTACGLDREG